MSRYDELIKRSNTLSFEEANSLFEEITNSVDLHDEDEKELFGGMIRQAIDYATIRSNWQLLSLEESVIQDRGRSIQHDAFISSLSMLTRFLDKQGKGIKLLDSLEEDRKRIGDFACFIAYVYGLESR